MFYIKNADIIIMLYTFVEFERLKKLQKYVIPQKSIRILNIIGEGSHDTHTCIIHNNVACKYSHARLCIGRCVGLLETHDVIADSGPGLHTELPGTGTYKYLFYVVDLIYE